MVAGLAIAYITYDLMVRQHFPSYTSVSQGNLDPDTVVPMMVESKKYGRALCLIDKLDDDHTYFLVRDSTGGIDTRKYRKEIKIKESKEGGFRRFLRQIGLYK
jgi:hypothetical protein